MGNNKKVFLFLALILSLTLSGCIGGNVEGAVKNLPEVQEFLDNNPNADMSVVLYRPEQVAEMKDNIIEKCRPVISVNKSFYRVTVEEGNDKIVTWLESDNEKLVCMNRDVKGVTEENRTEDEVNTNKTEKVKGEKEDNLSEVDCGYGGISVFNVGYNDEEQFELDIANTGSIDLEKVVVSFNFENYGKINFYPKDTLKTGEVRSYAPLSYGGYNNRTLSNISVFSSYCSEIKDIVTNVGIPKDEDEDSKKCSFAGLSLYDAILDKSSKEATVSIANTGTQDLTNISVVIFHNNGSTNQGMLESLHSGNVDFISMNVSTRDSSTISSVRIASTECPRVTDETTTIKEN